MKNLITSFLVFHFSFFIFHSVYAQWGCSCLPEGITFTTQEQIDSFAINYPGCSGIQGDVTIGRSNETTDISNLNGLNVLTSIGGDLMIYGNYYLTCLDGLESLTSIGGSFSTGVIPGIPWIGFVGSINLANIEALSNLTNIGGDLKIWGTGLSDLSGLEGLTSIPGDLQIGTYIEWPTIKAQAGGNSHLKNIDGIENIVSVGGNLQLEFNDSLTDIASLNENITIDTLIIRYNSSLGECAVQTICNHLYQATGYSIIELNAPGCNSPEEVEEACLVGVGQLDGPAEAGSSLRFDWTVGQIPVIVYPNPFSEIVHLEYEIENPSPVSIMVFNAVGEKVAELSVGILAVGKHQIIWNAAHMPAGLYFCKVQMGQEVVMRKIVKL